MPELYALSSISLTLSWSLGENAVEQVRGQTGRATFFSHAEFRLIYKYWMHLSKPTELKNVYLDRRESGSFTNLLAPLVRDSFRYMLGSLLIGLANVVLVPLYTRYLSPSEFGVYALIEITALVLITTAGLGFNVSYLSWFAEVDAGKQRVLLGTMVGAGTLASLIAGSALAVLVASPRGGVGWR